MRKINKLVVRLSAIAATSSLGAIAGSFLAPEPLGASHCDWQVCHWELGQGFSCVSSGAPYNCDLQGPFGCAQEACRPE